MAQWSAAVGKTAALEHMLAPEKDARIISLRRKEQRRDAQYGMEMQLLCGMVAYQRYMNKLKLLMLGLQTKHHQLGKLCLG